MSKVYCKMMSSVAEAKCSFCFAEEGAVDELRRVSLEDQQSMCMFAVRMLMTQ